MVGRERDWVGEGLGDEGVVWFTEHGKDKKIYKDLDGLL